MLFHHAVIRVMVFQVIGELIGAGSDIFLIDCKLRVKQKWGERLNRHDYENTLACIRSIDANCIVWCQEFTLTQN